MKLGSPMEVRHWIAVLLTLPALILFAVAGKWFMDTRQRIGSSAVQEGEIVPRDDPDASFPDVELRSAEGQSVRLHLFQGAPGVPYVLGERIAVYVHPDYPESAIARGFLNTYPVPAVLSLIAGLLMLAAGLFALVRADLAGIVGMGLVAAGLLVGSVTQTYDWAILRMRGIPVQAMITRTVRSIDYDSRGPGDVMASQTRSSSGNQRRSEHIRCILRFTYPAGQPRDCNLSGADLDSTKEGSMHSLLIDPLSPGRVASQEGKGMGLKLGLLWGLTFLFSGAAYLFRFAR